MGELKIATMILYDWEAINGNKLMMVEIDDGCKEGNCEFQYINQDQAQQIINHLKTQFDL